MRDFPQKFKLEELAKIFSATVAAAETEVRRFLDASQALKPVTALYDYDQLTYAATISHYEVRDQRGQKTNLVYIKMSNDGFLYCPSSDLRVRKAGIHRHHGDTWCLLDRSSYEKPLQSIEDWAKDFFQDEVKMQVFYNYEEERIDIKLFPLRRSDIGVALTFEPGYPDEDFKADNWDYPTQ